MSKRKLKPGWQWVTFGEVVRLSTERCADPLAAGLERYVGLEHIEPEDLRLRRWGLVADGITFTNRFRPGQVLFGKRRAYQRKVAVADFEGVCSGDIYIFESKDPAKLLPELLPFICQTEGFFEHAVGTSAGSLSPRTNWSQLAQYEFALPPLEEQRRRVILLQKLEALIETSTTLVSKLDSLRKTYILHAFSSLVGDTTTRLVKVYEAGDPLMGRQLSPKYQRGISPKPYLRVANVFDGFIDLSDVNEMDFSDKEFEQYQLRPGDILLVEGHSSADVVGRSAIFKGEISGACFQNTLIRFRPKSVSSEFAHQYFRYCLLTGRFSRVAKQTTIAHLGSSRFAKMDFLLPNRDTQEKVVGELNEIESALLKASQRQIFAKSLKQKLFESLFASQ
jgi:type I restriction enzyme, S subunit